MINDLTPNLGLPLPHKDNLLEVDVERLRNAFSALDTAIGSLVNQTQLSAALTDLVGAAPEALNQLQEFAEALNNDPDFAGTIATQLGTISSAIDLIEGAVSDLQTALADKSNVGHGHAMSQISGLDAALAGKAAATHTHPIGQVVGLADEIASLTGQIASKAAAASPTLSGQVLIAGSFRQNVFDMEANDINCAASNYFRKTVTANTTLTLSNVPDAVYSFTLRLTLVAGTVTMFPNVIWPDDEAPDLAVGKTHLLMFAKEPGSATWRASALPGYSS